MSYWTDDVVVKQTALPGEILEEVAQELRAKVRTIGVKVSYNQTSERNVYKFIISSEIAGLSIVLFRVYQSLEQTYPVVIDSMEDKVPEFLKEEKTIIRRNTDSMLSIYDHFKPYHIFNQTNDWVCSTPEELTEKLQQLLGKAHIIGKVVSLQLRKPTDTNTSDNTQNLEQIP